MASEPDWRETGEGAGGAPARPGSRARRSYPRLGLLVLSALWSLHSLGATLLPRPFAHPAPELTTESVVLAGFVLVAAAIAFARRQTWPRSAEMGWAAACGVCLFAIPGVVAWLTADALPALTRVAIYSLTPLLTVVLEPHIAAALREWRGEPETGFPGAGTETGLASLPVRGGMVAAIAGVAGMLSLLPLELPGSLGAAAAWAATLGATLSIAAGSAIAVQLMQRNGNGEHAVLPLAAIVGAAGAVPLGVLAACVDPWRAMGAGIVPDLAASGVLDVPALFLLFWLMARMSAARLSARFLLAPLFTTLGSLLLFQPGFSVRIGVGLLLLGAGALWLACAPDGPEEDGAQPLGLRRR